MKQAMAKNGEKSQLPVPDVKPVLVNFSSAETRPAKKDER
jgi:hypothetical protein